MGAAASRRPRRHQRDRSRGLPEAVTRRAVHSLALAVMDERGEPARLLRRLDGKVNAVNGAPGLDQDRGRELGGLGGLASFPGLETVSEQLAGLIAVLRAEQARRQAASRGRHGRTWSSPAARGPASPGRPGRSPASTPGSGCWRSGTCARSPPPT